MKRPMVAAFAVGLVAVPGASAKPDLTIIRVCGPSACLETRAEIVRERLSRVFAHPYDFASAPAVAPYYELRGEDPNDVYGAFIPGRPMIRWNVAVTPAWYGVDAAVVGELERVASGVLPYAQPRPVRVVVDGRLAKRPARFAGLFGELPLRERPRATGPRWIAITIVWNRPNPWTDASSMFYDRDDRALFRGGRWFRVPPVLVREITRR